MNPNFDASPIAHFIRRNFSGATITVTLVNNQTVTGEVVDGFDNVIGLKDGAVITFVNAFYIVTFV
jgi:hypothetical protein